MMWEMLINSLNLVYHFPWLSTYNLSMDKARYRRIIVFFGRILTALFFWEIFLPRIGFRKLVARTRSNRLREIARKYHDLAIRLGGVHIKVGQFLSTRMDVLPEEITDQLTGLQDEVPPEDFEDIRLLIETELGGSLADLFEKFEVEPMAAASLGQVHRARLNADEEQSFGREIVVKIQRPNIETIINTDLQALQRVSKWVMRYELVRKRADVPALLAEFTKVLTKEIDYLAEGSHAEKFKENFKDVAGIRVPAVVWPLTTKRVLTLEDVYAIKITDYEQIKAANIDMKEAAERLFDTYMRQIFEHGFFHADPHPGNLFVDPNGDENSEWYLTFIDFGMVGELPSNTREGLKEFLIGLGTKDAKRIIKGYQLLDILLPSADLDLLEQAEAQAFDRFWGKSMDEMRDIDFNEMHEFAKEFRELVYELPFQVPQDLIFLFRTVAILAGICVGLDPEFNLWTVMAPYAEKMVAEEASASTFLKEAGSILQTMIALPRKAENVLDRLNRGGLVVQTPATERGIKRINQTMHRLIYAVIFLGFLMAGTMIYIAQPGGIAYGMFGAAVIFLVGAVLPCRPGR